MNAPVDTERLRALAEAASGLMPDLPWSTSRHCFPATLASIYDGPLPVSAVEAFQDAVSPEVLLALLDKAESARLTGRLDAVKAVALAILGRKSATVSGGAAEQEQAS